MKLLITIFKFFASLRLAVALLILLAIAFGAGTFIESYYNTDVAQAVVYRTPWMAILMICLALNLLASALDRIPWKKKHVGFLTTHLGIILILSGSLISHAFGIEGQLVVEEGKTGSRMTLTDPLIQIFSVDRDEKWTIPLKKKPFGWKGREEISQVPLQIHLLADYPKAKLREVVEDSSAGSPAIHFHLVGSMASMEQWLFLDDSSRNVLNLGPATARFSTETIKAVDTKTSPDATGILKLDFESGQTEKIKLTPKIIGKTIKINGTPFQVKITRILKDSVVDGNQLIERKDVPPGHPVIVSARNPALELILEGNGLSERHTVFARFPEFPTLHGMKPSDAHVRISYEFPEFQTSEAKNELRFVWRANELPKYQIKAGEKITEGIVELGREISTGWMDFKFTADEYYKQAQMKKEFLQLPASSQSAEAVSVIQAEFSAAGESKTVWLEQGEVTHIRLGDLDYHVLYGLKTRPLGFQIQLKDFQIETNPGTDQPASFRSSVILKDPSSGIQRNQIIQMNEPLKYHGFKVYQSAYQQEPGQPDTSIFTVARDPGNALKYAGAIIMIAGIMMLFYIKSLSTLKGSDPKLRTK